MPKKYKDMSGVPNAVGLSTYNEGLQLLVKSIFEDASDITLYGESKPLKYFFNHFDNRDPSTGGGPTPGDVTVHVYYQPASVSEYNNWEVIDNAGFLSGRRRLVVRIEKSRGLDDTQTLAFYTTTHPQSKKPGIKDNSYGVYVPINPAK